MKVFKWVPGKFYIFQRIVPIISFAKSFSEAIFSYVQIGSVIVFFITLLILFTLLLVLLMCHKLAFIKRSSVNTLCAAIVKGLYVYGSCQHYNA